ncbi:MAG: hypothetical protein PUC29_05085 [Clostridia bacterium]|nr:hypothetical protein [Clostridia bacterium]
MIKGCQKKIIHITNPKSPYFEEAYFVLKRGGDLGGVSEADMVKEALRIADEAVRSVKPKAIAARRSRAFAVAVGAAAVSLIFGIVMLFYTVSL